MHNFTDIKVLLAVRQCLHLLTCDVIAQNLDSNASRFIWTPMAAERKRKSTLE